MSCPNPPLAIIAYETRNDHVILPSAKLGLGKQPHPKGKEKTGAELR